MLPFFPFCLLLRLLRHVVVLLGTCSLLGCGGGSHGLNLTAEVSTSGVGECGAHSSRLNILCGVVLPVVLYMDADIVCIGHK